MQKELTINGLKFRLGEEEPIYKCNGLMWTKTFYPMPWKEAMDFCENLNYGGYSDWRLATRKDLVSIIDDTKYDPATELPDTLSSTDALITGYAWDVYSYGGSILNGSKSSSLYVRAVRGGKGK